MNILEYENYQENKQHGDAAFPYNTYLCTIPLDFTAVPLHWHEEMEFIFIKKGFGSVSVDLHSYDVTAGSVIVVLPGQLHAITQKDQQRMEYENIIFHPQMLIPRQIDSAARDFILPLLGGTFVIPAHFQPSDPHYSEIASILKSCDSANEQKREAYQIFLKSQLLLLLYLLINSRSHPDENLPAVNQKLLDRMKPVLKYVELHYADDISIQTISTVAGISPAHFMRTFKEVFHCSFIEYLKDYRLTMAARLLGAASDTILTIAEDVGFDNLSYFNRSFKAKYGLTPGKYRSLARSNTL